MSQTDTTYQDVARSFDHRQLEELEAYQRLRQAVNDLATQTQRAGHPVPLGTFLEALQDMAWTTPYADGHEPCIGMTWPSKVEHDGEGWLLCHYFCRRCQKSWTCGYAVSMVEWGLDA